MSAAQQKPSDGGGQSPASLYNKTHLILIKLKGLFREQTGGNITLMELTHLAVEEFHKNNKDSMGKFKREKESKKSK